MDTKSTNDSFLHALSEIRNKAANLRKLTEQSLTPRTRPSTPSPPISIPTLDLPPIDIPSFLENLDISGSIVAELSLKVQEWVSKIQRLYQQKFEDACRNLLQSSSGRSLLPVIEGIRQTFQYTYMNRHIPSLKEKILHLRSRLPRSCQADRKIPFKNEHRPLLEKYFKYNAYPTAQERLALAQQTRMTARQIEVWFQNHRNRAKKDGKKLARRSGPPPRLEDWNSSTERKSYMESESDNDLTDNDLVSSVDNLPVLNTRLPCPFATVAPPHAFPNRYPSNSSADPFPSTNGIFTFPPIVWTRKPKPSGKLSHRLSKTLDMDGLAQMFSMKLNLNEKALKNQRQSKRQTTNHSPWYTATIVVPYSAPLPSLIRPTSRRIPCLPSTPCTGFRTPSQGSLSFGLTSSLSRSKYHESKLRKATCLPRRWPTSSPSFSPSCEIFDASTSSASSSRASSFTSTTSSRSRLSSSSSFSSTDFPACSLSPIIHIASDLPDQSYDTYHQILGAGLNTVLNDIVFDPAFILPFDNVTSKFPGCSPPYDLSPFGHYLIAHS